MSAAWCGRMASWPSLPGAIKTSTPCSTRTTRSAVTTSTVSGMALGLGQLAAAFDGHIDVADHVERLLRETVVLAFQDLLEAADSFADGHVLAGHTGELLRHEHGLREEALNLASAGHGQLVVVGEFIDAQDGDDVLQVAVALEHALDAAGDVVVLLPD